MFCVVELLYRTDFFPGLGWMLERSVWQELEPKWPITYVCWQCVHNHHYHMTFCQSSCSCAIICQCHGSVRSHLSFMQWVL